MSELEFNEFADVPRNRKQKSIQRQTALTRLLIAVSGGLIKNEKQANLVSVLVIVVSFIFVVIISLNEVQTQDFDPDINPVTGEVLPQEL